MFEQTAAVGRRYARPMSAMVCHTREGRLNSEFANNSTRQMKCETANNTREFCCSTYCDPRVYFHTKIPARDARIVASKFPQLRCKLQATTRLPCRPCRRAA